MTEIEEAYARARAEGKGPSNAYRAATDTSRMKASTIAANAKRFERKAIVKARIEELRQGGKESEKVEFRRNIARAPARARSEVTGRAEAGGSPGYTGPGAKRGARPAAQAPRPAQRLHRRSLQQ